MLSPPKNAVCKAASHTSQMDPVSGGNRREDLATKQAAEILPNETDTYAVDTEETNLGHAV